MILGYPFLIYTAFQMHLSSLGSIKSEILCKKKRRKAVWISKDLNSLDQKQHFTQ